MLKHISVAELRLGMYVHEFCGSGIEQSFWKNGFMLSNEHDLQRILDAKVAELWIDDSRGVSPVPAAPVQSDPALPTCLQNIANKPVPHRVALNQEISRSLKLCAHSRAAVEKMFSDLRMGQVIEMEKVSELVEEISDSLSRHPDALISLARLKTCDEYTYMHSVAVCALMVALARQLGLPPALVHEAGVAGLMHDVGKVVIPLTILNKPGALSDEEFATMRSHSQSGADMLRQSHHFSPRVMDVCLHHHEKIDGTGYPHRLAGSQISLFARMGAVCDVYDAVTSDRPYKEAWGPAEAIHRMAQWQGHFDEKVFQAFVKCVGIYPVGALVRMESGRIGVVIEQHEKSLLTPKVRVFFCANSNQHIAHTTLNLAALVGQDRIVGRESAKEWGFSNLDELWAESSVGSKSNCG
ncbi:HD-GYP domain-containing protein [Pseudomonas sp. CDFA 553]|uniref:HD-GYP domain-containing protein n=1 Tax=Pseudomonas quasicaspiana TaxID=2829821 RepID=UPI001E3938EC|nr:HD-GYP domain-containing protein [Pseudomonas quasicaspiana]MCD5986549.1 HD-GYP domain-containing protein [Pseudomonas quasicaspiana]